MKDISLSVGNFQPESKHRIALAKLSAAYINAEVASATAAAPVSQYLKLGAEWTPVHYRSMNA